MNLIECVEPHARPTRRTLEVEEGQDFAVYVLPAPSAASGLRRTIVRPQGIDPPVGARLVCWMRASGSAISVVETGPGIQLEMLRGGLRSRVVAGGRLPPGAPLELTLPDDGRVAWSVTLRRESDRNASHSVSGSGTRTSRVRYGTDNPWWILTDTPDLLLGVSRSVWDQARDGLTRLGVDNRVTTMVATTVVSALLFGWVAYNRHSAAVAAEEQAKEAMDRLALAEAAQGAALATELACLKQRHELVSELGRDKAKDSIAAETALGLILARTASREIGGARMSTPEAVEMDQLVVPSLIDAVVARMGQFQGDPGPCLDQEAALGKDLPRYLLLWHPNPNHTCPADYESGEGGVRTVGRFGLSDRLAREFGAEGDRGTGGGTDALQALLGDPRREDRWSAFTVAQAYRRTVEVLLRTEVSDRPPTLQSQSHVWGLALLDAYNRMPSPAGGVLDSTLQTCVEGLLREQVQRSPPSVAGEPLLPDIVAVAQGEVRVSPTPTPGCPWPVDAIRTGSDAALRAVARLASVPETTGEK